MVEDAVSSVGFIPVASAAIALALLLILLPINLFVFLVIRLPLSLKKLIVLLLDDGFGRLA